MNAPTTETHLDPAAFELLPLTSIAPSATAMQAERRRQYTPAALEELAASIREGGVAQPIVVRPLKAIQGDGTLADPMRYAMAKYELIAGERRWQASDMAGLAHIPAVIRSLSDEQVIKLQLAENIHREALHPVAEARGYRELIDGGLRAELIGETIGKSRSYVYARVKLLELCPAVQEALEIGQIDASQALLFARIPTAKLQEQALKTLSQWSYQGHGERLSFRRTAEILQDKGKGFLIPLAQVPFKLDDTSFYREEGDRIAIALPACTVCPKRSGNDPELLAALEDAHVCTDRACHDLKAKQEFKRRRAEAEASGREILTGDAAAAIAPTPYGTHGYVDLDDECDDDHFPEPEPEQAKGESEEAFEIRWDAHARRAEAWQRRTYRALLGEAVAALDIKLIQDPKHKTRLRELAPDKAVSKLLQENLGIKTHITRAQRPPAAPSKPESPEAARRAEEKAAAEKAAAELEEKIERTTRERLVAKTRQKHTGVLRRDDLELLAEVLIDQVGFPDSLYALYPKSTPATMNERDLGRFLVLFAVCEELDGYRKNSLPLKALCKRLKIDAAAVRKQVKAELTPKREAAPAPKPAAKKAAGKGKKK